VEPLEFHSVDLTTIPHVNGDLDWVNTPIPAPIPVFQTLPAVADYNPFNNQLAEALQQLSENLNKGISTKASPIKGPYSGHLQQF